MLKKITYNAKGKDVYINTEALEKVFKYICVYDSNSEYNTAHVNHAQIVAIGAEEILTLKSSKNTLTELENFRKKTKGYIFGFLTYEIKNEIENLLSNNEDHLQFPLLSFFSPKLVIQADNSTITLFYNDKYLTKNEAEDIYRLATNVTPKQSNKQLVNTTIIQPKINKEKYINTINMLKQHIHKGDIYEVNFCQEFFAKNTTIYPTEIFDKLNRISRAPFSSFCKFDEHYIISASPERYLQKQGNHLISQPIKGTIKRSKDKIEDENLKEYLKNSKKEQSENVMIVDLTRNDFSRIAIPKSVKVDELFKIYSYKQVHQMISTISCDLAPNTSFTDIIKSTFPMGSMTGAPKVRAMQLIENYEDTKRGLYSGAIGYIDPDGNFDFNVVIRTILYNSKNNYLSFMVGSAITENSIPEMEYEECLLKAKALFEVLDN